MIEMISMLSLIFRKCHNMCNRGALLPHTTQCTLKLNLKIYSIKYIFLAFNVTWVIQLLNSQNSFTKKMIDSIFFKI